MLRHLAIPAIAPMQLNASMQPLHAHRQARPSLRNAFTAAQPALRIVSCRALDDTATRHTGREAPLSEFLAATSHTVPMFVPTPNSAAPAVPSTGTATTASGGAPLEARRIGPGPASYWELLNNPEQEQTIFGNRARSATDANVLRRKGHLKEQDYLIDYMRRMHETHTCEEVMIKMERWIAEHRQDPRRSRLRRLVPQLGNFFTGLKLLDAFKEYDTVFSLSRRKYIPPNFAELRHIVNIAQVHASADALKLITFDADGTLYADGAHFDQDNAMIAHIINLMRCNVHVGIVTAAGYPGEADKFERRLSALLETFRALRLPPDVTGRFHIMGGECNYLLRVTPETKRLEFVPDHQWQTPSMRAWREEDIQAMLTGAETLLVEGAKRLNLGVQLMRKPRSVGIVPQTPTIYEVLEDIALTVQNQLQARVPFCAFNGGNDVFVDAGNKSLGLQAMMAFTGAQPHETLHVGDRFTLSGNDTATRDVCSVLWVANPEETGFFIKMLLQDIRKNKYQPYIE